MLLSVVDAQGKEWSYSRTASLGFRLHGVKVPTRFVCRIKHFQTYVDLDPQAQMEGYVIESGGIGGRDGFNTRTKFILKQYQELQAMLCLVHPFLVWQRLRHFDISVEQKLESCCKFGFEEVCRMKRALLDQLEEVWVEIETASSPSLSLSSSYASCSHVFSLCDSCVCSCLFGGIWRCFFLVFFSSLFLSFSPSLFSLLFLQSLTLS